MRKITKIEILEDMFSQDYTVFPVDFILAKTGIKSEGVLRVLIHKLNKRTGWELRKKNGEVFRTDAINIAPMIRLNNNYYGG